MFLAICSMVVLLGACATLLKPQAPDSARRPEPSELPSEQAGTVQMQNLIAVPDLQDGVLMCGKLAAKASPEHLADAATAIEGPLGDGRSGANGFVVRLPDDSAAYAWTATLRLNGDARGAQFIHPFQAGHVVATITKYGVTLHTDEYWPNIRYTGRGRAISQQNDPAYERVFPLVDGEDYLITIAVYPNGVYTMYMADKRILTARVPEPGQIRLGEEFTTEEKRFALEPRQAVVLIGPRDTGRNRLTNVMLFRIGAKPDLRERQS